MTETTIKTSGALVLWDIPGTAHPLAQVRAAWTAAGLDRYAPRPRTPDVALRTALHSLAIVGAGRGTRRIERAAEGLVVTETEPEARTVRHRHVCFAQLVADVPVTDAGPQVDAALGAAYRTALAQLDGRAVSAALTDTARGLGAVALRPDGGVYWVPAPALAQWRGLVAGVEAATAGGRCYVVQTQGDPDTVRCVADSFTREAEAALAEVAAELEAGDLGERAAQSRARRLADLAATAEEYEAALGASLLAIRERLEALGAEAAAAALLVG